MSESNLENIFHSMFFHCLSFDTTKDKAAFVFDQFGFPVAESASDFAYANNIDILFIFAPYVFQKYIDNCDSFLSSIIKSVNSRDALITALSSSGSSSSFRIQVVSSAIENKLRVVHMPGVSNDILLKGSLNLNYTQLHNDCLLLKDKLSVADSIRIITKSTGGTEHVLSFSIKGRPVHICGGLVGKGEIINMPTGEVYLAPIEGTAQGSFVLNGSSLHSVFFENDEVILSFRDGNIIMDECVFSDGPDSINLKDLLEESILSDPATCHLGEFGIGTNSAITKLTGDVLLDEKKSGTVHIALGHNKTFGGNVICKSHHDLIFYPAKIVLIGDKMLEINL